MFGAVTIDTKSQVKLTKRRIDQLIGCMRQSTSSESIALRNAECM